MKLEQSVLLVYEILNPKKYIVCSTKIPSKLEVAPHALKMLSGVDTPKTITNTRAPTVLITIIFFTENGEEQF